MRKWENSIFSNCQKNKSCLSVGGYKEKQTFPFVHNTKGEKQIERRRRKKYKYVSAMCDDVDDDIIAFPFSLSYSFIYFHSDKYLCVVR